MALVTRISTADAETNSIMFAAQIPDAKAGEAIDACAPCYIKASDGLVYMSNGTAANEASKVVGFSKRSAAVGQPVTLFGVGSRFEYATGMTPGQPLYVGATKGRLDTAPTVGCTAPVAFAVTATHVIATRLSQGLSGALPAVKAVRLAGAAAGDVTLTGIAVGDTLIKVFAIGPTIARKLISGGSAGDHTVTGITTADMLIGVWEQDGTSGIYTDRTSEFTIASADTINNGDGTDTTGDKLDVMYQDSSTVLADLTSEFTVAAGKINNTGGTNTTGMVLLVLYNDLT